MTSWRTLNSKPVHKNPYFQVHEDEVMRPDGSEGSYWRIERGHGVVAVPFDGQRVLLVNLFRYPLKARYWELPMGNSESEDFQSEAARELKEETGYTAAKWSYLGHFSAGSGTTDRYGKVYLAEQLSAGSPARDTAGEQDMTQQWFMVGEVDAMIRDGTIVDGWTICAWHFFKEHLAMSVFSPPPVGKGERGGGSDGAGR